MNRLIMIKLTSLLFLMIGFSFTNSVNAGFLIEPYVGYVVSGSGEQTVSTVKTEYDYDGLNFGARLGYNASGVIFGADYSMGSVDVETTTTAAGVEAKATNKWDRTNLGLFVGYQVPMFRFWGSYFLDVEAEDTDGINKGDSFSGNGFGLGGGFKIIPWVSLNAEYRILSFEETKDASAGTTTTYSGNETIDLNEFLVSLSFPFDF